MAPPKKPNQTQSKENADSDSDTLEDDKQKPEMDIGSIAQTLKQLSDSFHIMSDRQTQQYKEMSDRQTQSFKQFNDRQTQSSLSNSLMTGLTDMILQCNRYRKQRCMPFRLRCSARKEIRFWNMCWFLLKSSTEISSNRRK